MTTREWHEADQDDADRVRAWPAQDEQEPNDDFETAFCFWKIEALENANEQLRSDLRDTRAERNAALAYIVHLEATLNEVHR